MITATLTLDSQSIGKEAFEKLVRDGKILSAKGIINTRWDEVSALDLVRDLNLEEVEWDYVEDDSPGSLTVVVEFQSLLKEQFEKRIQQTSGVEQYELLVEEMAYA